MPHNWRRGVAIMSLLALAAGCGGSGGKPASSRSPVRVPMTAAVTPGAWTWGYGGSGQLGDGRRSASPVPVKVLGLDQVTAIAGSTDTRYALRSDGTVWAWGSGRSGELGNGAKNDSAVPVKVTGLTKVTAISDGYALRSDGTVWAWGNGTGGALGNGHTDDSAVPVQVNGLTKVTEIAGAVGNGLALKSDGTVWAWGTGEFGLLGNGTTKDSAVPVRVKGLGRITAIAFGASLTGNAYALAADTTVWSWGYNADGALGNGATSPPNECKCSDVPVLVAGLGHVKGIAGGYDDGYAVTSDGTVWAWGSGEGGALGDGSRDDSLVPVQVHGLTDVIAVSAGSSGYALRSDGTVWAWGDGQGGALGDGRTDDSTVPVRVSGLVHVSAIGDSEALVKG
jgi:alpha-tubulin suppressor-like RCC1 family protein